MSSNYTNMLMAMAYAKTHSGGGGGGGSTLSLWESTVDTANWVASSNPDYPWVQTITDSSHTFSATVPPIWDIVSTSNLVPTSDELDASSHILWATFDTNAVTLYADVKPTINLKIQVVGV